MKKQNVNHTHTHTHILPRRTVSCLCYVKLMMFLSPLYDTCASALPVLPVATDAGTHKKKAKLRRSVEKSLGAYWPIPQLGMEPFPKIILFWPKLSLGVPALTYRYLTISSAMLAFRKLTSKDVDYMFVGEKQQLLNIQWYTWQRRTYFILICQQSLLFPRLSPILRVKSLTQPVFPYRIATAACTSKAEKSKNLANKLSKLPYHKG